MHYQSIIFHEDFILAVAKEYKHAYTIELCRSLLILVALHKFYLEHNYSPLDLEVKLSSDYAEILNKVVCNPPITTVHTKLYAIMREFCLITSTLGLRL